MILLKKAINRYNAHHLEKERRIFFNTLNHVKKI